MQAKRCKGFTEVDWEIRTLFLACKRSTQESDNSRKEAILESGGAWFSIFCPTGEEKITKVGGPRLMAAVQRQCEV